MMKYIHRKFHRLYLFYGKGNENFLCRSESVVVVVIDVAFSVVLHTCTHTYKNMLCSYASKNRFFLSLLLLCSKHTNSTQTRLTFIYNDILQIQIRNQIKKKKRKENKGRNFVFERKRVYSALCKKWKKNYIA